MQSENDAQTLNRLKAKVDGLSLLTAKDSALLAVTLDQAKLAEAQLISLQNQINLTNSKLERLSALIDETYVNQEKKNHALDLLIRKLQG